MTFLAIFFAYNNKDTITNKIITDKIKSAPISLINTLTINKIGDIIVFKKILYINILINLSNLRVSSLRK